MRELSRLSTEYQIDQLKLAASFPFHWSPRNAVVGTSVKMATFARSLEHESTAEDHRPCCWLEPLQTRRSFDETTSSSEQMDGRPQGSFLSAAGITERGPRAKQTTPMENDFTGVGEGSVDNVD